MSEIKIEGQDANLGVSIMISENIARIMLSGILDFDSRKMLREAYTSLLDNQKVNTILVEMGQVSTVTTGGMGILYLMQEHCDENKKILKLAHPVGQVKEWLLIANHNNIFNLDVSV
jgi:anti-anti-sigma factor